MANNYDINYDDQRFAKVETDKTAALNEVDKTYGDMIGQSDKYYQDQISEAERWGNEQQKLQDQQTDFTLQKIEQQKEQAQKDYIKEQSGAYVDWQKQSNQYGAEAEKMASTGLQKTGYSESSQVSMYNTYQNRVAVARESINQAMISYNNDMTQARLQNSVAKAEIAAQTLQKKMELALQGFQYKNTLITEQANKKLEVENIYYNRYLDVLNQINTENAMAEEIRQYNESLALQKAQFEEEKRQFNEQMAYNKSKSSGGGSGGGSGGSSGKLSKESTSNTSGSAKSQGSLASGISAISALGYGPRTAQGLKSLADEGKITVEKTGDGYSVARTNLATAIKKKFSW